MESKPWYLSKAIWGGLLGILGLAGKIAATQEVTPDDITYFGVVLGLLGIRFRQN